MHWDFFIYMAIGSGLVLIVESLGGERIGVRPERVVLAVVGALSIAYGVWVGYQTSGIYLFSALPAALAIAYALKWFGIEPRKWFHSGMENDTSVGADLCKRRAAQWPAGNSSNGQASKPLVPAGTASARSSLVCSSCGFWPKPGETICDNCHVPLSDETIAANVNTYPV